MPNLRLLGFTIPINYLGHKLYTLKCLLFILSSCVIATLNAQVNNDSLRQYSYRVFSIGSEQRALATGFFYKANNKLYFITAKHVFSGCVITNNSIEKDTLYPTQFLLAKFDVNKNLVSTIVNTSAVKDTTECLGTDVSPDIISFLIPEREAKPIWDKINSIEQFSHTSIKKNGSIQIFGYPSDSFFVNNRFNISNLEGSLKWDNSEYDVEFVSAMDYYFLNKNKNFPIDSLLKGYSGSPVFYKEENSEEWKIAGVFSGMNYSDNKSYIRVPKIDIVISDIKNRQD